MVLTFLILRNNKTATVDSNLFEKGFFRVIDNWLVVQMNPEVHHLEVDTLIMLADQNYGYSLDGFVSLPNEKLAMLTRFSSKQLVRTTLSRLLDYLGESNPSKNLLDPKEATYLFRMNTSMMRHLVQKYEYLKSGVCFEKIPANLDFHHVIDKAVITQPEEPTDPEAFFQAVWEAQYTSPLRDDESGDESKPGFAIKLSMLQDLNMSTREPTLRRRQKDGKYNSKTARPAVGGYRSIGGLNVPEDSQVNILSENPRRAERSVLIESQPETSAGIMIRQLALSKEGYLFASKPSFRNHLTNAAKPTSPILTSSVPKFQVRNSTTTSAEFSRFRVFHAEKSAPANQAITARSKILSSTRNTTASGFILTATRKRKSSAEKTAPFRVKRALNKEPQSNQESINKVLDDDPDGHNSEVLDDNRSQSVNIPPKSLSKLVPSLRSQQSIELETQHLGYSHYIVTDEILGLKRNANGKPKIRLQHLGSAIGQDKLDNLSQQRGMHPAIAISAPSFIALISAARSKYNSNQLKSSPNLEIQQNCPAVVVPGDQTNKSKFSGLISQGGFTGRHGGQNLLAPAPGYSSNNNRGVRTSTYRRSLISANPSTERRASGMQSSIHQGGGAKEDFTQRPTFSDVFQRSLAQVAHKFGPATIQSPKAAEAFDLPATEQPQEKIAIPIPTMPQGRIQSQLEGSLDTYSLGPDSDNKLSQRDLENPDARQFKDRIIYASQDDAEEPLSISHGYD